MFRLFKKIKKEVMKLPDNMSDMEKLNELFKKGYKPTCTLLVDDSLDITFGATKRSNREYGNFIDIIISEKEAVDSFLDFTERNTISYSAERERIANSVWNNFE